MPPESLEERVRRLEEKNDSLEHEVMRLQAINQIQNLMGRYEAIHNFSDHAKTWELFAQHTPDTWCEIADWGLVEGIEDIKKLWTTEVVQADGRGIMFEHDLTTPVIVVARDGKTAKATWWSPGHETREYDGKQRAVWCWGKYAIDFVKEDGEWKIWHFKWFRTFISPVTMDWRDRKRELEFRGQVQGPWKSKSSKYHNPYFPDVVQVSIPPAPRPYDTWTEEDKDWHLRPIERP